MQVLLDMQRPDGHLEYWYGEGNFNRTAMLYALMQSRGVRPVRWRPGLQLGAVQDGQRLRLSLALPRGQRETVVRFDAPRHRRVLNLDRNYVRLNEFPECGDPADRRRLGRRAVRQRNSLIHSNI
jgi:hypothetical protein